jgi:hypothetical protein
LFNLTSSSLSTLDPASLQNYHRLIDLRQYSGDYIVEINWQAIKDQSGSIIVDLPFLPYDSLLFLCARLSYISDSNFTWTGQYFAIRDTVSKEVFYAFLTLIAKDGVYFGQIESDEGLFDFTTLNGRLLWVGKNDYESEGICGSHHKDHAIDSLAQNPNQDKSGPCTKNKLSMLVLYTQEAADEVPNIQQTAILGVEQIKTIISNSTLDFAEDIELAGTLLYSPPFPGLAGNPGDDLVDVKTDSWVIGVRAQYNADVVILIEEGVGGGVQGFAGNDLIVSFDQAFCLVDCWASTNGSKVFAHEFFHLFNARHNNDGGNLPCRADKFYTGLKRRCTIMIDGSSGSNGPCSRRKISYLSSPYVYFEGRKTGKYDRNNVKTVSESYETIAAYYPDNIPLTTSFGEIVLSNISAECVPNPTATAQLIMHECATPPFLYQWQKSTNGFFTQWSNISPTSNTTYNFSLQPITGNPYVNWSNTNVRCRVTDGVGNVYVFANIAWYYCNTTGSEWDEPLVQFPTKENTVMVDLYPNPSYGETFVKIRNPVEQDILIEVVSIQGVLLRTVKLQAVPDGATDYVLGVDGLPSGSYTVKVRPEHAEPLSFSLILID